MEKFVINPKGYFNTSPQDCEFKVDNAYATFSHTSPTPLSNAFFSKQNVEFIRNKIADMFQKKYNISIGPQPYQSTEVFMFKMFNDVSGDMDQYNSIMNKLSFLNKYTLDALMERISRNFSQHIAYLKFNEDASRNGPKILRPELTRREERKDIYTGSYFDITFPKYTDGSF